MRENAWTENPYPRAPVTWPHDHQCECGEELDRSGLCPQCDPYNPNDDPRIEEEETSMFYIKYETVNTAHQHEFYGVFNRDFLDNLLTNPHKYAILECRESELKEVK